MTKALLPALAVAAAALAASPAPAQQYPSGQVDCVHYHTRPKACGPEISVRDQPMTANGTVSASTVAMMPKKMVGGEQLVWSNNQWNRLVAAGAGNFRLVAAGAGN